jgi:hypothetical protein
MHFRSITPVATALALLTGCASTLDQEGLEQRTAQAVGRSVGQFFITDRKEETGGRINYTVNTRDGMVYRSRTSCRRFASRMPATRQHWPTWTLLSPCTLT